MTTALFLLRCTEIGVPIRDLELLSVGMVMEMFAEKQNDGFKYPYLATQEDFDKF